AEDGIRDRSVTGVQTCALPISGQYRPSPVERRFGEALPVVLDGSGVLTQEEFGQFLDRGTHGLRPPFHHGFTPADDSVIGLHPAHQPPGWDQEGFDTGDFHCGLSRSSRPTSSSVARSRSSLAWSSKERMADSAAEASPAATASVTAPWLGTGSSWSPPWTRRSRSESPAAKKTS